jgi:citrate lyase subunit beta/citryl-CoA lyase
MKKIRPRRSVLYMPGSNARAMEKAQTLKADALILDLEDAVAGDVKDVARKQVCEAVSAKRFGKREVIIRANALSTPWGRDDLKAAAAAGPDAILFPKISSVAELKEIEDLMRGANNSIAVWAMIETPRAILNIEKIADFGGRLACFVMGTNDLIKETHGVHTPDRANLAVSLSMTVLAARAAGLAVLDGVFNGIAEGEAFADQCRQAKAFGFDGKTLIHPNQLDACNAIFAPTAAEIENARKIIAAFEEPENRDKGAIKLDGKMVERLHADMARQTVSMADAIAELEAA